MIRNALASLPGGRVVCRRARQSGGGQRRGGPQGVSRRRARWRRRLRRRLGPRRRQGHRVHVGADAPALGFRGRRRLVDARRSEGHRADCRGAHDGRHRQRSGARRRHPQRGDASEEDHLPSEDDAGHRHRGSRAHGRPAAEDHRRHGLRRVRALLRGVLRAGISSARRRRGARRHAAHQDLSTARLQEWRRPGSALAHAGRGQHGRHGVPERTRRRACHRASGGFVLRHASWAHERGDHAVRDRAQPRRDRRAHESRRARARPAEARRRWRARLGARASARSSAFRIRWRKSA